MQNVLSDAKLCHGLAQSSLIGQLNPLSYIQLNCTEKHASGNALATLMK